MKALGLNVIDLRTKLNHGKWAFLRAGGQNTALRKIWWLEMKQWVDSYFRKLQFCHIYLYDLMPEG